MKKYTISSLLFLFVGAAFAQQHYQYQYDTSEKTTIEYKDIDWTSEKEIGDNRDKVYLTLRNEEESTVTISGGNNITFEDGASLYITNNTNLVIGDADGNTKTELKFTNAGKDTFLEMTQNSSILVQKNGVLTFEGGVSQRYWNPQTGGVDKDFFVVDGGTVNGNINIGTTSGNAGFVNTVFKNGATLNRTGNVNPLGISGKAKLTFDNSTYNVWSADYSTQNGGWGNHIINTAPDNHNFYGTYTFTNGSVINGAGYLKDGKMTYFDFSGDMVRQNADGTTISGVGLSLQPGRQLAEDGYFRFEILNGAKVSANGMNLGNNSGQNTQTHDVGGVTYLNTNYGKANSQITMGEVSFLMKSDDADNMAQFQGFGGTNLMGSQAVVGTETSTFNLNYTLAGNAKYYTLGDFNIGTANDTSGTINVDFTGKNNIFRASNININGGENATNLNVVETKAVTASDGKTYAELVSSEKFAGSTAVVNAHFGENTTNSSFTFNGMNVRQGKYSQINVKFTGDTNTFTSAADINMFSAKDVGGNAISTIELATGGDIKFGNNQHLYNYGSGENYLIVSNGTNATFGSASLGGSEIEGGTAKSYYIIDSSSVTTLNDSGYNVSNNSIKSGEVGIILRGDGAKFISQGQMNIHVDNSVVNTGGKYIIKMEGTNGLFQAQKNLHFLGLLKGEDAGYSFEMTGSGNMVNVTTGNFGLGNENSTAGTYRLYSKSDSATNKNTILLGYTRESDNTAQGCSGWAMHGSYTEGHTNNSKTEIILAGNTVLKRDYATNYRVVINALEDLGKAYNSGNILFEVRGSGNEVYASNLKFGNSILTGGTATLRVSGGGSIIDASALRVQGGADFEVQSDPFENRIGGVMEFFVDDTGISTVKAAGIDGALTGLLSVDFSNMQGNYENERFVLISANNGNLKNLIASYWYDFDGEYTLDRMQVTGRGLDDESIVFAVEDSEINAGYKDFVVYYTGTAVIPEPSTYAAIFGALALAFVAYRKKRA